MKREEKIAALRESLSAWFQRARRDLPWRRTRDPYAIWVSEIMLQQTRVETVTPRFSRWMARFPTVSALARAPLDEVLAEWAGLGYYARARNLHGAAREVAERYGGELPDDRDAVRALPGIGRYTAGAILSIAFAKREPILDGNVIRVLSRAFAIEGDPRAAEAQEKLWSLAEALVGGGDPSTVNQGLMELGATVCTPRKPECASCPWEKLCDARREGDPEKFPAATKKTPVRALDHVSIAISRRGKLLLARRPPRGLWGGLFELPTGEPQKGEALAQAAARIARERVGLTVEDAAPIVKFQHVLSHRKITFHAFSVENERGTVRCDPGYDAHKWATAGEARSLGLSRATSRMLDALDAQFAKVPR
jgi:A/G-specific adenine glycosylase